MILYMLAFLLLTFLYIMYLRYFPVKGIPCVDLNNCHQSKISNIKVDLRDYNIAAKQHVDGAIEIPIAYLKRYYHEIPSKEIHVIANDQMEKNIGVRFLKNKGYNVVGYTIMNCNCKGRKHKLA